MISRKTNPIIICGVARSGTTFARDLLDAHPDIAMSDEFFIYKMPSIEALFTEIETAFVSLVNRGDWSERKGSLMRMFWFYTSKGFRIERGMTTRRFGNKTPGAEHYIQFYDSVFEGNRPIYVYLLREGEKVFLSRYNVSWGNVPPIQGQLKRYIDSIETIENFREQNLDRVFILQLDRIEPTFEARLKETKKLFSFIGEDVLDDMLPFMREWRPIQTTEHALRKTSTPKLHELPNEAKQFLGNNKKYQSLMEKYAYK